MLAEELWTRIATDDTWMMYAACRGVGSATMHPTTVEGVERALAYCRRCEVRPECYQYGVESGSGLNKAGGAWGGVIVRWGRVYEV